MIERRGDTELEPGIYLVRRNGEALQISPDMPRGHDLSRIEQATIDEMLDRIDDDLADVDRAYGRPLRRWRSPASILPERFGLYYVLPPAADGPYPQVVDLLLPGAGVIQGAERAELDAHLKFARGRDRS